MACITFAPRPPVEMEVPMTVLRASGGRNSSMVVKLDPNVKITPPNIKTITKIALEIAKTASARTVPASKYAKPLTLNTPSAIQIGMENAAALGVQPRKSAAIKVNIPANKARSKLPKLLDATTSIRVRFVVPRKTSVSLRRSKAVAIAKDVNPAAMVETVRTVAKATSIPVLSPPIIEVEVMTNKIKMGIMTSSKACSEFRAFSTNSHLGLDG